MTTVDTGVVQLPVGEPDFAALYSAHAATAHRLAKAILRDGHLAADAVQEAFLSLWLLGDVYAPERGGYGALLRTLVHHRAVDILRSRGSGPGTVPLDEATAAFLVDVQRGPESSAVAADQTRQLMNAVDSLTPAKREALLLAYEQGRSHAQIAGLLSVPLGTVKARIRAAKIDLVQQLSSEIGIVD